MLTSQVSNAQYESEPVAQALDLTAYQPFSDRYRVRRDDFTRGGSSLQVLPPLNPLSGVTGGYFVDDFVTVTFDYKYNQRPDAVQETLEVLYGSPDGLVQTPIPPTGDEQWCTRSYYLDRDVGSFQWSILFDPQAGPASEVLFDNFRVESGNRLQPQRCFIPGPDPEKAAQLIGSLLAVVLTEDEDDPVVEPERAVVFGTVSLPSGLVAPAGGVEVQISTFPITFVFEGLSVETSSTTVVIPAGGTEVDYEFPFLVSGEGVVRQLEYECLRGCVELDLATGGLWSSVTGTTDFFGATDYDVNTSVDVPIELEPADSFAGIIDFPGTQVATGEEQIVVTVEQVTTGFDFPERFSFYYYPEAGDPAIDFAVGVPTDSSSNGWIIEIRCNSCASSWEEGPQYVARPSGYQLVTSAISSYRFLSNTDYDNILLTLLLKPVM